MADMARFCTFTFDDEEIEVLLRLTGNTTFEKAKELGIDLGVFRQLHVAFEDAAYGRMFEEPLCDGRGVIR